MSQSTSKLSFDVSLDEHKVPETIQWHSTDGNEGGKSNAAFVSIWDDEKKQALKIDLWTKEMLLDDMKLFYYQMMISMADTFERATSDSAMSKDMKDFARYYGEKMKILEG